MAPAPHIHAQQSKTVKPHAKYDCILKQVVGKSLE